MSTNKSILKIKMQICSTINVMLTVKEIAFWDIKVWIRGLIQLKSVRYIFTTARPLD